MSIDAGAQVAIIVFAIEPCVVILNCLGQVLYLGRAPRTKETLPDFHESCRVTRHPHVFCRLTGCQRTPRDWGVTNPFRVISLLGDSSPCRGNIFFRYRERSRRQLILEADF